MIRVDSTQLINGKTIVSLYAGHGIQAQNIPSTGTNGAGYLYNDIAAQGAAATDEMRGEVLTYPSSGTFSVNEDSSFSFTGATAGTYTASYRGFRNGVSYGDYTITLQVGGTQFRSDLIKQSLVTSFKQLSVQTAVGASVGKLSNLLVGKQLTITTGTEVPFNGNLTRLSLTLNNKLLSVTAEQNLGFSGNIQKASLLINAYSFAVTAGSVIPFSGDIQLSSYTLNGKSLVMADTTYPVIPVERLFFFRNINKTSYIL